MPTIPNVFLVNVIYILMEVAWYTHAKCRSPKVANDKTYYENYILYIRIVSKVKYM